tara:strand:+ start:169 stop:312 length:144 start_codon:yes stop_codon:yes gene_type:complete
MTELKRLRTHLIELKKTQREVKEEISNVEKRIEELECISDSQYKMFN